MPSWVVRLFSERKWKSRYVDSVYISNTYFLRGLTVWLDCKCLPKTVFWRLGCQLVLSLGDGRTFMSWSLVKRVTGDVLLKQTLRSTPQLHFLTVLGAKSFVYHVFPPWYSACYRPQINRASWPRTASLKLWARINLNSEQLLIRVLNEIPSSFTFM